MPQTKRFVVTLYPAKEENGALISQYQVFGKEYPSRQIDAANVPTLVAQIAAFADGHGEGCRASVKCLAPRKPNGFDKETKNLYYNLDNPPDMDW